MPLIQSCSMEAFQENIRTESASGKSRDQAVAIARQTLEDACGEQGKPVPKSVEKKKERSRDYLEAALDEAKKTLPGWAYAAIVVVARSRAGGKIRAQRRLTAAEKSWLENAKPASMTDAELMSLAKTLQNVNLANSRQKNCNVPVVFRAAQLAQELVKRDLYTKDILPMLQVSAEEISKGFLNQESEGGMHAHTLDRLAEKTMNDGPHTHIFVLPGTKELAFTWEDGQHEHALTRADKTAKDGDHSHIIVLPDGSKLETSIGGKHEHETMVETTGLSGLHQHELRLQDGTIIKSLLPQEFADMFLDASNAFLKPMPSARQIVGALQEVRFLQSSLVDAMDGQLMPEAVEVGMDFAKTQERPEMPNTDWQVDRLGEGAAWCSLSNSGEPRLLTNSHQLNLAPGDIVEVNHLGEICKFSKSSEPFSVEQFEKINWHCESVKKATTMVDFVGPSDAKLVFVSASPGGIEIARRRPIVGPDGALFQEQYLEPLGISKSEIALGFAIPVYAESQSDEQIEAWRGWLVKSLSRFTQAKVIALGKVAKQALGSLVLYNLPHPAALRRHGDRGEVARKIKSIRKALDNCESLRNDTCSSIKLTIESHRGTTLADAISELRKSEKIECRVAKSVEEKRIIYGIVLDPYQVDLQNDWIPPAEIEEAAHEFLKNSRIIGLEHEGKANAEIVESSVIEYPDGQRELALQNLPHKAFRRKFGTDTVHSGAWLAGVQLSEPLWEEFQNGQLDAFSIGGFSFKSQVSEGTMPEVEFIED